MALVVVESKRPLDEAMIGQVFARKARRIAIALSMSPMSSMPRAAAATEHSASLSRSVPATSTRRLPFAPVPRCSLSESASPNDAACAGTEASELRLLTSYSGSNPLVGT